MLQQLINRNDDLKRLFNEDLVMEEKNNFLIIHRIPYLNQNKKIKYGSLVTKLQLAGDKTIEYPEHTVYFAGELPCRLDGTPFNSILLNSNKVVLFDSFAVNFQFSSKPKPKGYPDYYQKMRTYINMISAPAKAVDESVTEKGTAILNSEDDSPFQYMDTNASKPELSAISEVFKKQKIAIIGLGGTGSYILDLVSKVPIKEIHLYDEDWFYNNNAFRAPGAASKDDLIIPQKKVEYFKKKYSNMHKVIIEHPENISSSNMNGLMDLDFVFISIDGGPFKKELFEFLEKKKVPFIDVGMGVVNNKGALTGLLRVTTGVPGKTSHIWKKSNVSFTEGANNEYDSNIQIAELNSLNAALAVIKWKKINGYYHDRKEELNMFYRINANYMLNETSDP